MITKYEIDVLDVADADAILIHFEDEEGIDRVIAIDAGRYSDGEKVAKFVRSRYQLDKIDMAICTHCDYDHYGGFIKIIEQYKENPDEGVCIKTLWVNDPGKYVDADDFKRYQKDENAKNKIRSVYTLSGGSKNLLEIAKDAGIRIFDIFSEGGVYKRAYHAITFLGPTRKYFEELVPFFDKEMKPYDTTIDNEDDTQLIEGKCLSPKLDKNGDDDSTHNQSSVIILFEPKNGEKFVFMGDAGYAAFNNMKDEYRDKMRNAILLKVPHHGSKYNMNSTMINVINPQIAIVSAKSEEKYFSPLVKNALKRKGAQVYCTMSHNNLWYNQGFDERADYNEVQPL